MVVDVESKLKQVVVPTWGAVARQYFESCRDRGLTERTIHGNQTCIVAHTFPVWESRLIDSITTQEIRQQFIAAVGEKSPGHKQYVLKCIRAVFQFAVECTYIQRNPTPQMKIRIGEKIQKVLTEDQARILLAKAKELNWEWYPHYAVALYTGLRCGELYALTWDKVDFDQRTILVNESWNSRDGFKETKSGNDRLVEIAPALLPLMRELKEKAGSTPYVLPHLYQWQKGEQAQYLKTFLLAIGLPVVRFHDLRATWATMLLSKGIEPIKLLKLGGWKDLETMMIYARKAGVDIRGSTECLNLHGDENSNKILKLAAL